MSDNENESLGAYGALPYLPPRLSNALRLFCLKYPKKAKEITEVRLRCGGAFSVSVSDKNLFFDLLGNIRKNPLICTLGDLGTCVELLCGNSYQAHEEEIKQGYISMENGFRAGIAPNAVSSGSVYGINSVCIRIPTLHRGCAEALLSQTGESSMLIYSPPGVGKTTLLKDIVSSLCKRGYRCAVIDTRRELSMEKYHLADYLCGCPKAVGIEIATRTLCPQFIICDEIGASDVQAILSCKDTGVPLIASCHGDSYEKLMLSSDMKTLRDKGVFSLFVGLSRVNDSFSFDVTPCI